MGEKIRDTTKLSSLSILTGAMMEQSRGREQGSYIEDMEAQGQTELVNSDELPTQGSEDPMFAKMGIVFGEPTDDLFRKATLPVGWKKVASDHAMGSSIVDEKGRVRAMVFYKAAFYDRKADIHPTRYFTIDMDPETDHRRVVDQAGNVFQIAGAEGYLGTEECDRWLDENYPNHKELAAYWDEEPGPVPGE